MSRNNEPVKNKKEAMKNLRKVRKKWITRASIKLKTQKKLLKAIKEQLEKKASTVPDISQVTKIPADTVLWYLATLKKYGEVIEGEKDGDYFQYALVEGNAEKAPE